MADITELAPAMNAAAELITSGYSRKWIVSHDDETCWVGANDDDGNLTPFIEVSITDWSGNKDDNETLARFIALCRPANVLALVEALEKAQRTQTCEHSMFWDASGVKRCSKCDLPEHANVHYADAAEMEIAALRQRIAELESRTVTVKLLDCDLAVVQHMSGGSMDYCNGFVDGTQNAIRAMRSAGVDVREDE